MTRQTSSKTKEPAKRSSTRKLDDHEVLPEADRLEGCPHPREMTELYGHEEAKKEFLNAWQSGRMHHAWMLCGPSGIGKATLAYHIARMVLDYDISKAAQTRLEMPDAESKTVRQITALSNPNLLVLRRVWNAKDGRFSAGIPVDEVRRLRHFVGMTGEQGRWRVVIVDRADEMNANAANALLKSLEEPPANCLYFLITEAAGKMPPTIRSRCRKLDLQPLSLIELNRSLQNVCPLTEIEAPEPEKIKLLHQISGGSVRQSLELIRGKGLETYETLLKVFRMLPKMDYAMIHALADKLAPVAALPDFELFYTLLSDLLHRLIRTGAGSGDAPEAEIHIALKLVKKERLAQWAELWETLARTKLETQGLNLDRKNFILDVFHKVQVTAQG